MSHWLNFAPLKLWISARLCENLLPKLRLWRQCPSELYPLCKNEGGWGVGQKQVWLTVSQVLAQNWRGRGKKGWSPPSYFMYPPFNTRTHTATGMELQYNHNTQQSTFNTQHSTLNIQHPTLNTHTATWMEPRLSITRDTNENYFQNYFAPKIWRQQHIILANCCVSAAPLLVGD